jgi:hypothetical protein
MCRFELLCRIRIARGFGTLEDRRQLVKQRLLAFNVLLQCSPTPGELAAMTAAEILFLFLGCTAGAVVLRQCCICDQQLASFWHHHCHLGWHGSQ